MPLEPDRIVTECVAHLDLGATYDNEHEPTLRDVVYGFQSGWFDTSTLDNIIREAIRLARIEEN